MRIDELANTPETDMRFDIVDDASYYMRNDPSFYRKQYFPCMSKLADMHSAGKKVDRSMLNTMVEKGINNYVQKYNLGKTSEDVFKQPDRDALIDMLFSEEMAEIKKGEYK